MSEFMQQPMEGTVSRNLHAGLQYSGGVEAIRSLWRYESTDPLAIHVTFTSDHGESVNWQFSRDLLLEALRVQRVGRIGLGDLQFTNNDRAFRERSHLVIHLISHEDHTQVGIYVAHSDLEQFAHESTRLVPVGAEVAIVHEQIDAEWESFAINRPEDGY